MSTGRDTSPVSLPAAEVSIERPAVYVVATPIGNLGDLGIRAAKVLAGVDVVFSEDTRHSHRLLDAYGISTTLRPLHDHNEKKIATAIVADLRANEMACALISDAGTPLISDPGYMLVREAAMAGVRILAVPGPCAATAALSVSGLATDRFVFEGFLPSKPGARARRLAELRAETRTIVFYEAPHRVVAMIDALAEAFGPERECAIARELTKAFESVYRGSLADMRDRMRTDANAARGELVVVVSGNDQTPDTADAERVLEVLIAETDTKTAVRIAATLTGLPRNRLYEAALKLSSTDG